MLLALTPRMTARHAVPRIEGDKWKTYAVQYEKFAFTARKNGGHSIAPKTTSANAASASP